MLSRVAQAIATAHGQEGWQAELPAAKAAILAMREPTLAMLEAAVPGLVDWGFLPDEWRAMIDYAAEANTQTHGGVGQGASSGALPTYLQRLSQHDTAAPKRIDARKHSRLL
jgi:hypothetical protein